MVDQEQLKILKQGGDIWNKWRKENRYIDINLSNADLKEIDLSGAYLSGVNFSHAHLNSAKLINSYLTGAYLKLANLNGADLTDAYLYAADLTEANLNGATLTRADLNDTKLIGASLTRADLTDANLRDADLSEANLYKANLMKAKLLGTHFYNASLREANCKDTNFWGASLVNADLREAHLHGAMMGGAILGGTHLGKIDLRGAIDLIHVWHRSASILGTDTLQFSKGEIPTTFLRGCGLSDWEIEVAKLYNPNLQNQDMDEILYKVHDIRAHQPIQISPLFISYSHADSDFVDRVENFLNEKGIRFWRDVHHATSGKLEKQIDQAIRHNPTVLLVLSKNSIESDWVQHEVRLARKLEKDTEQDVLCPVALDDSWKTSPWPERIMEQVMEYNILDFSKWKDDGEFNKIFVKLITGLNLYYQKQ